MKKEKTSRTVINNMNFYQVMASTTLQLSIFCINEEVFLIVLEVKYIHREQIKPKVVSPLNIF